jgi:hypothetical protein
MKTRLLAEGMRLSGQAEALLKAMSNAPLSIHEYPTTGGITLVLDGGVYVNAPFDEWYCDKATTELRVDGDQLVLCAPGQRIAVLQVVPLPSYLNAVDCDGNPVADVAMSHVDRVRLSPLIGCAYTCGFCDLHLEAYTMRSAKRLIDALRIAAADPSLPARHVLISGGSPRKAHYEDFISICEQIIKASALPIGLMMSPMVDCIDVIDRLVDAGAVDFAINLELFSAEGSRMALRGKYLTTRKYFEATVGRAVELLGTEGRVRSLIIAGLEEPEETLRGVDYLAALGCDPVLSPFRPAQGTPLMKMPPPSATTLAALLDESRSIAARHGVALGPTCSACQHNTLSFPWDLRTSSEVDAEAGAHGQ